MHYEVKHGFSPTEIFFSTSDLKFEYTCRSLLLLLVKSHERDPDQE